MPVPTAKDATKDIRRRVDQAIADAERRGAIDALTQLADHMADQWGSDDLHLIRDLAARYADGQEPW